METKLVLENLQRYTKELEERHPNETAYWHLQKLRNEIERVKNIADEITRDTDFKRTNIMSVITLNKKQIEILVDLIEDYEHVIDSNHSSVLDEGQKEVYKELKQANEAPKSDDKALRSLLKENEELKKQIDLMGSVGFDE